MQTANVITSQIQAPPAQGTRLTPPTPYEQMVKYFIECKAIYQTGNPTKMKSRSIPDYANGGINKTCALRYLDVIVNPKLFDAMTKNNRKLVLEYVLFKMTQTGFLSTEIVKDTVIYHLTDKYKTHDVNELIED
ncbi:hypothetical protein ACXEH2_005025 [Klebsiella pneumoniae]